MIYVIKDSGDLCELTSQNVPLINKNAYRSGLPEHPVYPCVLIYQIGGNRPNQLDRKAIDTVATFSVSIFHADPRVCDEIFKQLDVLYTANDLTLYGKLERWELEMQADRIYHINCTYRARTTEHGTLRG